MIKNNFLLRTLSSLVLMPVVLFVVWMGGALYEFCVVLLVVGCFSEWIGLTHKNVRQRVRLIGHAGLVASLVSVPVWGLEIAFVLSLITWLAVLLSAGRFPPEDKKGHRTKALWLSFGIPYLAWSGMALVALRLEPDFSFDGILYLFSIVWATDIGAYLVGRTIGGPKIWPQISPKKTWAGLFGGMLLAVATAYAMMCYMGGSVPVVIAFVAALLALIAQTGDFFESYVKRRAGVKDSGNLIPGHGGLLDRVDGVLFVALITFVWFQFLLVG